MSHRISHQISRSRRSLTILVTSVGVIAGTALVAPAQAAPLARTDSAAEVVTPDIDKVPVPALKQPEEQPEKRRTMSAPPEPSELSEQSEHGEVVAATGEVETEAFSMLGVTWRSSPEDAEIEAEVRVRDAGGWTDWQHLHAHNEEVGTAGTAPLWVGEADAVDVRVLSSTGTAPQGIEVDLIDPGEMTAEPTAQPMMSTTAPGGVSKPGIISRQGWGADPGLREHCSNGRFTVTNRVAFVHHTAGSNNYSRSRADNIVRGVYAYHTQSRGWCDIGYNFLVDRYGRIYEGRFGGPNGEWLPVYGAHTGGYNNHSFGVSLMGCFQPSASVCDGNARPTSAMMNATARLIAWKLALNYRNPKGHPRINGKRFNTISGHRDAKSTACPGIEVYERLPWLRNRVDAMIGTYNSPIYRKFRRLGASTGLAGAVFFGEHRRAGGTVAHFRRADILHTSRTGAHEVHGAIRKRYRQLKSARGVLGFPTTDEVRAGVPGSRRSNFQDGRIYWSARTDAHEVYGGIHRRYIKMRGASGLLGLPTSGELATRYPGGRHNRFQDGRIYWHRQTGAHEVYGAILNRYKRLKSAAGRLELPTTGEYGVPGGRKQRFMGGEIRWDRSSRRTTVRFY